MRITSGLAAMVSLCLLAGCSGGAANNGATAPAANAAAPAATPATPERRARMIRACGENMASQLPSGTNTNAFCSCTIDKMLTNGSAQRDAIIECADEMHIQMQSG
jgi:hypothetical protein